jgi:hypothetical protein
MPRREVNTRHNALKNALFRAVLLAGGQAVREVKGTILRIVSCIRMSI